MVMIKPRFCLSHRLFMLEVMTSIIKFPMMALCAPLHTFLLHALAFLDSCALLTFQGSA